MKNEFKTAIEITKIIALSAVEVLANKAGVSNQVIIKAINSKEVPNLNAQFNALVKQGMETKTASIA
jgi:hypothetical protein